MLSRMIRNAFHLIVHFVLIGLSVMCALKWFLLSRLDLFTGNKTLSWILI